MLHFEEEEVKRQLMPQQQTEIAYFHFSLFGSTFVIFDFWIDYQISISASPFMFFLPIPTFSTNSRRSACYLAETNVQCQVEIPTPASITTNRVIKQRLQVSAEIKRLRRLDESGIRSKIKVAQRVLTKITNNRSK